MQQHHYANANALSVQQNENEVNGNSLCLSIAPTATNSSPERKDLELDTDNVAEIRASLRAAIERWSSDDAKQRREEEEEHRYRAGPSKELHFMARSYENLMRLVTLNDRNSVREFLDARVPVDNAVKQFHARPMVRRKNLQDVCNGWLVSVSSALLQCRTLTDVRGNNRNRDMASGPFTVRDRRERALAQFSFGVLDPSCSKFNPAGGFRVAAQHMHSL